MIVIIGLYLIIGIATTILFVLAMVRIFTICRILTDSHDMLRQILQAVKVADRRRREEFESMTPAN